LYYCIITHYLLLSYNARIDNIVYFYRDYGTLLFFILANIILSEKYNLFKEGFETWTFSFYRSTRRIYYIVLYIHFFFIISKLVFSDRYPRLLSDILQYIYWASTWKWIYVTVNRYQKTMDNAFILRSAHNIINGCIIYYYYYYYYSLWSFRYFKRVLFSFNLWKIEQYVSAERYLKIF